MFNDFPEKIMIEVFGHLKKNETDFIPAKLKQLRLSPQAKYRNEVLYGNILKEFTQHTQFQKLIYSSIASLQMQQKP